MSLRTASTSLVGPGFEVRETPFPQWIQVDYVRCAAGGGIESEEVGRWLRGRGFVQDETGWWSTAAAMGMCLVEDSGAVAAVNISFDCEVAERLECWLSLCDELLRFGFRRFSGNSTAGIQVIRAHILESEAWRFQQARKRKMDVG